MTSKALTGNKQAHTPTPWTISRAKGPHYQFIRIRQVGTIDYHASVRINLPESEANASFIVRACNNYEELLEACKLAKEVLRTIHNPKANSAFLICNQAIAKAEAL